MRSYKLSDQTAQPSPTVAEPLPLELVANEMPPPTPAAAEHVDIFQLLVDGQPEQAGLIDAETGVILAANEAWVEMATLSGYANFEPGNNYIEELAKIAAAGNPVAVRAIEALHEIRQGKRSSARLVYEGAGGQANRHFEARIARMNVGEREYIRVTRYEITELSRLRTMRDGFNAALMKVQEDERRRMGRELHDSSMQLLAGISLSLARLNHAKSKAETAEIAKEMKALVLEAQMELRSISFLAHPPQLERFGLVEALRILVTGFGDRAKLRTTFAIEGCVDVPNENTAHSLFRMVQEALSNVHRHARATKLTVRLDGRDRALHVIVADNGRGIPADLRHGVGLLGMRSRMQELGGRLTICDGQPGTAIVASLPNSAL